MASGKKGLFTPRGAIVFYMAIFLNAAVDLGHKITIQNTIFKLYAGDERIILTALVNSLILLPYIFFFAASGALNDRFPKAYVMRWSAWFAFICTLAIAFFYWLGWFWLAFAMVALLGIQSAFFGPAKLAYIRVMYRAADVVAANGAAQAVVIVAILASSLGFSLGFEALFVAEENQPLNKNSVVIQMLPLAVVMVALAAVELLLFYRLPERVDKDQYQSDYSHRVRGVSTQTSWTQIKSMMRDPLLRAVVMGLTMFWSSGQVMLAVFPEYFASQTGQQNTAVIQGVLACLAVGVGFGATAAGKLSRFVSQLKLVSIGGVGLVLSIVLILFAESVPLAVMCFLFAGSMGGLFIVPLYAAMQLHVPQTVLGKTLAINNLVQNIFMVTFLVGTVFAALHALSAKAILISVFLYALITAVSCIFLLRRSDTFYRLSKEPS